MTIKVPVFSVMAIACTWTGVHLWAGLALAASYLANSNTPYFYWAGGYVLINSFFLALIMWLDKIRGENMILRPPVQIWWFDNPTNKLIVASIVFSILLSVINGLLDNPY